METSLTFNKKMVFCFCRQLRRRCSLEEKQVAQKLIAADPDYCGEYIIPSDVPGKKSRMAKPHQAVAKGYAKICDDGRTRRIRKP